MNFHFRKHKNIVQTSYGIETVVLAQACVSPKTAGEVEKCNQVHFQDRFATDLSVIYLAIYNSQRHGDSQYRMYLPNPSAKDRMWYKVIFKRSTAGLNSVFLDA